MKYLLSILIIVVLASQATVWHSLATIRDTIQQTNAIILVACGSDERIIAAASDCEQSRFMSTRPSTTLADLLRPPLVANPFSTMRASLRRTSSEEVEDGVEYGGAKWACGAAR